MYLPAAEADLPNVYLTTACRKIVEKKIVEKKIAEKRIVEKKTRLKPDPDLHPILQPRRILLAEQ